MPLTLVAVPKEFDGASVELRQRNAIESWTHLHPMPEVLLFGNDPGVVALRAELGLRDVGPVAADDDGVPLVSDVLAKAERWSTYDHLCYVNSDIILLDDFVATCMKAWEWRSDAVLVGSRIDVPEMVRLDFAQGDWTGDVQAMAAQGSRTCMGSDFFAFPRGTYRDVPPFAVGRTALDNWMMWKAVKADRPLMDISTGVTAVHTLHRAPGEWAAMMATPGTRRNRALATIWQRTYTLADCSHVLADNGPRRRLLASTGHRITVVFRVIESHLRGESWF